MIIVLVSIINIFLRFKKIEFANELRDQFNVQRQQLLLLPRNQLQVHPPQNHIRQKLIEGENLGPSIQLHQLRATKKVCYYLFLYNFIKM